MFVRRIEAKWQSAKWVSEDGHVYKVKKKNKNGSVYMCCINNNCAGSVTVFLSVEHEDNSEVGSVNSFRPHTPGVNCKDVYLLETENLRKILLRRAETENTPNSVIFQQEISRYFKKEWMDKVTPNSFSVFGQVKRTNNCQESLNRSINRSITPRGNTWDFWGGIIEISVKEINYFSQLSQGMDCARSKKNKWLLQDTRIKALQKQIVDGEISLSSFLNAASHRVATVRESESSNANEDQDVQNEADCELEALDILDGWAVVARADPITVSGTRHSGLRNDGDGWRPVRDSVKHPLRLPPPTSAYYMDLGVNKKYYHVDPSPSNKVEVFAPAPPSILGSFSGFGHDTVKSRHPVKHKNPYKESFLQAESRPGYPTDILSPPNRHHFSQAFKQANDNVGQAYFFEASLSPPPRESAINLVPPPSSKGLAPNSYYLHLDQHTRPKPTASSYSPYLRQSLPVYGTPDYFKTTNPSTDPYRFYSPEPSNKFQYTSRPTNSHGRPPGIDYFGNNPFGDIHLNTHRPETKTPAKDVYEQLSHLGRPFQSSTVDPLRFSSQPSAFSSLEPLDYYSTSGSFAHQTTPKPFRPSPLIADPYPSTERPVMYVTPGPAPPSREVYPIPVTTLDIPSREELFDKPFVNTFQSIPETHKYHDEVTNKPTTTTRHRRPEVEVNTYGESLYKPTPFLPTPSTDLEPFVGEPAPTELITPPSETNEVNKPTRTRTTRPRYRKKKPTRKPEIQKFVETTTEYDFDTPANDFSLFNEEQPKLTTFDTLQNSYQTEQDQEPETVKYEEKPKRRRPTRPNFSSPSSITYTEQYSQRPSKPKFSSPSTISNTEQDSQRPSRPNFSSPSTISNTEQDSQKLSRPNFSSPSTISNTEQDSQRPSRPNFSSPSTISNTEQDSQRPSRPNFSSPSSITYTESDSQDIPTAFSTLAEEEEVKTSLPSSTTAFNKIQHRRRKKPLNRHRGAMRHGSRSTTSTTTTTTEAPQELASEVFTQTDYQNLKESSPTENYPFSGLAFNEYGHVMMHPGTDEYNTLFPTQQVDEYQTSYHEDETTTTTTTEPTTVSTTTTTTTTPEPETTPPSTTTTKTRLRTKYNFNNNRPRFSVKDYRERLNKATSTSATPREEEEETKETSRIKPTRQRGSISYKQVDNQEEQVETSTRKFKPRYTGQRHSYRTSTTQSPLVQLDTPTTTERQNMFRPSSQRRPGSNKYYSRYRTSTEPPESAEQPSTEKLPQRPKGVFSAKKRRPFPLRTRVDSVTKSGEEKELMKPHSESTDNDLDHDQYITKKSDHITTTTLMTSSEEADWNVPSSSRPEIYTLDPIDHGEITKKIADLTSSPSNSFDSSGFFKGVSPSSRRTVSQITLATEDPILPIEAFFSSSFNRNNDSR